MTTSAPAAEPCPKPITSGLPSGLRETVWNAAPAIPSAAPTSSATTTRGSRSSRTMNSWPGSPFPVRVRSTSGGAIR
jgi:hypothetical protein